MANEDTRKLGLGRSGKAASRSGPSPKAKRTAARLAAVQVLYQIELVGTAPKVAVDDYMRHQAGAEIDGEIYVPPDAELLRTIIDRNADLIGQIDDAVSASLQAHALDRLEAPLRAILRAGATELIALPQTPARIIINDYVDVAHGFFAGREPAMVNGVLDAIARAVRTDEVAAHRDGAPQAPRGSSDGA